jgi:hypothetical protein
VLTGTGGGSRGSLAAARRRPNPDRGNAVSLDRRYRAPPPVIDRVFNLNAVLAASQR